MEERKEQNFVIFRLNCCRFLCHTRDYVMQVDDEGLERLKAGLAARVANPPPPPLPTPLVTSLSFASPTMSSPDSSENFRNPCFASGASQRIAREGASGPTAMFVS
eukprot:755471-Hanusia_phi.AAC.1